MSERGRGSDSIARESHAFVRLQLLYSRIKWKVRIFSCTPVYFPYMLRKLPSSRMIASSGQQRLSIIITHLTESRLASLVSDTDVIVTQ